MNAWLRKVLISCGALTVFSVLSFGQTGTIEGKVVTVDGQAPKNAVVKIDRTDIKGNYKVKVGKKSDYLHAGLPLGNYNVSLEIDGKVVDSVNGVRTKPGDVVQVDFDLKAQAARNAQLQQAAETGQVTQEQARGMTAEQKAALEKAVKEREQAMRKNKELNESFNAGMDALKAGQFEVAVTNLEKAGSVDPNQHVIWIYLGEAYLGAAKTKTGEEKTQWTQKGLDNYKRGIDMKPDDAGYWNNYGLALAAAGKTDEAQAALDKAAQVDPPNAAKYYYNLGAILTNTGKIDAAGDAFKAAVTADPNHAEAQYQYGVFLVSKAQTTADGKVIPVEGTVEAFQKYIDLKPDGPLAESAKGMIAGLQTTVSTEYQNPDAVKAKPAKRRK